MKVKIKKLNPNAIIPQYATDGAGCFDLHACIDGRENSYSIHHGDPVTIKTGLAFEIPEGYVMLVYSRSGHGFKNNVRLANCTGVIDSDYRGEVQIKLTSDDLHGKVVLGVCHGDRIAQACLVEVPKIEFEEVDDLSDTDRGEGGFGSTGKQ